MHADILAALGDVAAAEGAYTAAIALLDEGPERQWLESRRDALGTDG